MYEDEIVLQRMQRFQPFQNSISSPKYEGYEPFSLEYPWIELLLELCQESWDILIDKEKDTVSLRLRPKRRRKCKRLRSSVEEIIMSKKIIMKLYKKFMMSDDEEH